MNAYDAINNPPKGDGTLPVLDFADAQAKAHNAGYQVGFADAVKAYEIGKPAAAQEAVAFRLLYKTHAGEWSTQGRPWADGKPDPKIVADAALPGSRWKIEYAYAAPVAAAPVDLTNWAAHYSINPAAVEALQSMLASVPAATVDGGQVTGWRNVNGMAVFTVASHSGITPDQEFVRYDDHLAAMASTPAAPGIDLREPMRKLYRAYVRLLESGRDRIVSLGGDCDPVDVMEANDIDLRAAREALDASPKGGSDAEVMQLRYQLNSLRQLLSGFDVAVHKNPLQPPCTYLEEVRLSHEFHPGCGHEVAAALRDALNQKSEGAKQ